jgi:hypothetical protein
MFAAPVHDLRVIADKPVVVFQFTTSYMLTWTSSAQYICPAPLAYTRARHMLSYRQYGVVAPKRHPDVARSPVERSARRAPCSAHCAQHLPCTARPSTHVHMPDRLCSRGFAPEHPFSLPADLAHHRSSNVLFAPGATCPPQHVRSRGWPRASAVLPRGGAATLRRRRWRSKPREWSAHVARAAISHADRRASARHRV